LYSGLQVNKNSIKKQFQQLQSIKNNFNKNSLNVGNVPVNMFESKNESILFDIYKTPQPKS